MSPKRLLRTFILIQIPLLILFGAVSYLLASRGANEYYHLFSDKDRIRPGASVIEAVLLLTLVIANVGVYRLWRSTRTIYLVAVIAAVVASLYLGPFANPGPSDFLETAMNTVSGIILGLAFFSPVREAFDPPVAVAALARGGLAAMPMPNMPMPWAASVAPELRPTPASVPSSPMPPAAPTPPEPAAVPTAFTSTTPAFLCKKCGAPWTGKKFCEECGASFVKKAECPSCGAELTPGKKFCGECGGPVQ